MKRLLIITQKVDKDDDVLGFFHGWIEHLSRHTNNIDVIALSVGKYSLPDHVRVFSIGKEKGFPKILLALNFYWLLLRTLPGSQGIFVHMAPEYVRALYPLNIFFKRPVFLWYAHIMVSPVAKWAMEKVQRIFTPSKESFSEKSDKIISTGHGIDTEVFNKMQVSIKGLPIVMALSRLSRVKRIHVFIESIHILRQKYPDLLFRVMVVGGVARPEDKEYVEELKVLVSKYDLNLHIEWRGPIKNIETPELYNKASVFVRLQGGGGFGKTELEAMSCGTPVVLCTNVYNNALAEFANDLYFPEDDAQKCAENIKKVLDWSDSRKSSYSQLSREIVARHHNIENLAERIIREFDIVLEK